MKWRGLFHFYLYTVEQGKRMDRMPGNKPTMFCNNCGGQGHVFKTCNEPVLSCGIILINKTALPTNDAKLLMIMRKDSMTMGEFLRGKYDPTNTEYIGRLLQNMTHGEHIRLRECPFQTLWYEFVGGIVTDMNIAHQQFQTLDIPMLLEKYPSKYEDPEWGFPKGRRIRGESDIACATREFGEETNIPRSAYSVLKHMWWDETFEGLNGIRYKHIYFPALLTSPSYVLPETSFTPMQRREISGIGWKTISEAISYVRPHHHQRKQLIEEIQQILSSTESMS